MSPAGLTIEPLLSAADREELGHLDYLSQRMEELRDRGRLAPDSYATVIAEARGRRESIERQGRFQAALIRGRALAKNDPPKEQAERFHVAPRYHGLDDAAPEAQMIDLPPVEVVDLRQELRAGNTSIFSRRLQTAQHGKQPQHINAK